MVGRRNLPCPGSYHPCSNALCVPTTDFLNLGQEIIWSFRSDFRTIYNLTFLKFDVGRGILRVDATEWGKVENGIQDLRSTDEYVLIGDGKVCNSLLLSI